MNYGFSYMEPPLVNGNVKKKSYIFLSLQNTIYQLQENMLQGLFDLLTISEDDCYIKKTT